MRKIIHIDMDAFYASVETRDNPALAGRPVLVGGDPGRRGVVASASYAARVFGIRSAMPMRTALRLCPEAIVIRPRINRYRETAEQLWTLYQSYTPLVEPVALDECYLDVTVNLQEIASATETARIIKHQIREQTGLTASAGVAPNKFLAKIASDMDKPDGLYVVKPTQVEMFLASLEVDKLWGVGPVTEKRLHTLGIRTVGALTELPYERLTGEFGKFGHTLYHLARGVDERPVVPDREPKQISGEVTFDQDVDRMETLRQELDRQAQIIERRLAFYEKQGRTVTVKVRYEDFTSITRSATGTVRMTAAADIAQTAYTLLEKTEAGTRPVRLIGVVVSGFDLPDTEQQEIPFPTTET